MKCKQFRNKLYIFYRGYVEGFHAKNVTIYLMIRFHKP